MILDCHMHSWRYPTHFTRPVLFANMPKRRHGYNEEKLTSMWDLPVEGYLDQMDGVVDKALLLGFKAGGSQGIEVPNEYLADLARSYPDKLVWACCVIPTEPGSAEEVQRWVLEHGAVAVGELGPAYSNYRLDDPRCFPVYDVAVQLDVPLVVHAGLVQSRFGRLKYADLMAVDEVAIEFPDLRIVICHLGYPRYEDGAFLVAKHENVYADIAWLAGLAAQDRRIVARNMPTVEYPYFHLAYPLLYYFAQTFGESDKLVWGTDYPAGTPRASQEPFLNINRWLQEQNLPNIPQDALTRIFHENWRKVFRNVTL